MLWQTLVLVALCGADPSGRIAFLSGTTPENQTVCVLDLATRTVVPVGPGRHDGPPVWSPRGDALAFDAESEGRLAIHVVRPDGSGLRVLNHESDRNTHPRWSPDGRRLAYVSGSGPKRRIAVYDLVADAETFWGGGATGLLRPVWVPQKSPLPDLLDLSRDCVLAVALRGQSGADAGGGTGRLSTDLVVLDPEKVVSVPSTHADYFEWAVEPDPRGRALAYESNDGGDREIYVASLKGIHNVSNHRTADWNPVWSPDGKWIAFESFRSGRRGLFRTYPETSRVYTVMASPDHDNWSPTWSPDGKWLAFISDRSGAPELYICDIQGEHVWQAASGPGLRLCPAWQPKSEDGK